MRKIQKQFSLEISHRDGMDCFFLSAVCGEITIISSHRHVFKRAMELDHVKMPVRYIPRTGRTIKFFKNAISLLPSGDYFFYSEDDGRRCAVYVKFLNRIGISSIVEGSVIRFKI